ncbi:hypothetical protein OFAG_02132 [Oxalobacter formigenes HOxBLS]|uniref:Uncharacterized protein n=1 Tax=Oxalobacter paraformigenes TaxID=556268 RepID=T5LEK1_9BURK|nr:hypothetical protein OFAG_02132 [Oxalobacter paraformigenes]
MTFRSGKFRQNVRLISDKNNKGNKIRNGTSRSGNLPVTCIRLPAGQYLSDAIAPDR